MGLEDLELELCESSLDWAEAIVSFVVFLLAVPVSSTETQFSYLVILRTTLHGVQRNSHREEIVLNRILYGDAIPRKLYTAAVPGSTWQCDHVSDSGNTAQLFQSTLGLDGL